MAQISRARNPRKHGGKEARAAPARRRPSLPPLLDQKPTAFLKKKVVDPSATSARYRPQNLKLTLTPETLTNVPTAEIIPAPISKILLRAQKLSKKRGREAMLEGIDLHCSTGEIVGLLGPLGAGKTTCLEIIAGLARPDAGRVIFGDTDVTDSPIQTRAWMGLAFVPQQSSVFRKMTVVENLLAVLEMLSLCKEERRSRCAELLAQFDLEGVAKQLARTLSREEQFRLCIARAMATKPLLLVLDEPFRDLDSSAAPEARRLLSDLRGAGTGILVSDQTVRECLDFVDRAYLMFAGKIVTQGDKGFLTGEPGNS